MHWLLYARSKKKSCTSIRISFDLRLSFKMVAQIRRQFFTSFVGKSRITNISFQRNAYVLNSYCSAHDDNLGSIKFRLDKCKCIRIAFPGSAFPGGPLSNSQIGLMFSMPNIGGLIGNVICMWTVEKYGRKKTMIFTTFPNFVSLCSDIFFPFLSSRSHFLPF